MQEANIRKCYQKMSSNYSALFSTVSSFPLRTIFDIRDRFGQVFIDPSGFWAGVNYFCFWIYLKLSFLRGDNSTNLERYFVHKIPEGRRKRATIAKLEVDVLLNKVFDFEFLVRKYDFTKEEARSLKLLDISHTLRNLYHKNIDDSSTLLLESNDKHVSSMPEEPGWKFLFGILGFALPGAFLALIPSIILFVIGSFIFHDLIGYGNIGQKFISWHLKFCIAVMSFQYISEFYEEKRDFYLYHCSAIYASEQKYVSLKAARNAYLLTDAVLFNDVLPQILGRIRVICSKRKISYERVLHYYLTQISDGFNESYKRWDVKVGANKALIDEDLSIIEEIRKNHLHELAKRQKTKDNILLVSDVVRTFAGAPPTLPTPERIRRWKSFWEKP